MSLRVLYVGNYLSRRGSNRAYCEELADRLEARGASVTRTSDRVGRAARLADMLYTTWSRRHAYDVALVSVFSGASFVWAEAVAFELRRLGKPYVLTLHGGRLPEFAREWPRRVTRLLGSAAHVSAPSGYLRERLRPYHAAILVHPNAVDASGILFAPRTAPQPRLVWLRAFHAIYNPTLAIEVIARLAPRFPGISLDMVGPDKGDGSLAATRERADALGVTQRVRFVGGVPASEVHSWLAAGDVFLNTTDVDNTPLSILEASAAGLCVVSTSVGGIPYLLAHERDALLVPPRDESAMTTAVTRALEEPGLAARLSHGARSLALTHDWPSVLAQWEHTLARVTRQSSNMRGQS